MFWETSKAKVREKKAKNAVPIAAPVSVGQTDVCAVMSEWKGGKNSVRMKLGQSVCSQCGEASARHHVMRECTNISFCACGGHRAVAGLMCVGVHV